MHLIYFDVLFFCFFLIGLARIRVVKVFFFFLATVDIIKANTLYDMIVYMGYFRNAKISKILKKPSKSVMCACECARTLLRRARR